MAADLRRRAPAVGCRDGLRRALGRQVLLRPDGLGARRLDPGHQPQHLHLRQAGSREVRDRQGVHAPDDPLRLPVPGARRRQGRVRGPRPVPRRRPVPHRPRSCGPDQPARPRPARRGLGEADSRGAAPPRHRDLQPLAVPDPGPDRLPGRDVHPDRGAGHQQGAAAPDRLVCRRLPAQAGDHPAGVGGTGLAHQGPGRGLPLRLRAGLLRRHPAAARRAGCAVRGVAAGHVRHRVDLQPRLACTDPDAVAALACTRPATRSRSASR